MVEIAIPEYIENVGNYLKTTNASGLLLHTSGQPSPYSDFDFYIVFSHLREKERFVRQAKEHAGNIGEAMPARLVLNWTTSFGGVSSLYIAQDEVVKVDINTETQRSIRRSNGILSSKVIFDHTGRLKDYLGAKKDNLLGKHFYSPATELQVLLEQYYGFSWNALSKIWKEDYRLVAFEMIPIYLGMIAKLEHACNGRINTNYFNSDGNMRPDTNIRLDDIEIRPQRDVLISTLEKLQALFHDLGVEVADKNQLCYPEEAERLFVQELRRLRDLKF